MEKLRPEDNLEAGGDKKDHGKLRMELIPPEAILALAFRLTKGAEKYAARNWEKGMDWSRCFGAMLRHAFDWWMRKPIDPDLGDSHLNGVLINVAFLIAYEARKVGNDDRPVIGPNHPG